MNPFYAIFATLGFITILSLIMMALYEPDEAIRLIKRYRHSWYFNGRRSWKMERFRMYAKERIQMKDNLYWGSKVDAVKNVVSTPEFQTKFKKSIYSNGDYDHIHILNQLVTDPRHQKDLKKAFNLEGSENII